jgi:hypothetical protein
MAAIHSLSPLTPTDKPEKGSTFFTEADLDLLDQAAAMYTRKAKTWRRDQREGYLKTASRIRELSDRIYVEIREESDNNEALSPKLANQRIPLPAVV